MKAKLAAMVLALCATLGAWGANVRLYVSAPAEVAWGDNWFCYAWNSDGDPLLGAWPGTQAVKTETRDSVTWHYLDVTANGEFGFLLNDGQSGKQTGDFAITDVSDGKAYFIEVANEANGEGRYQCQIVNVGVVSRAHGKVQLWENGPYWAETNIGADEPWDSGYYFWWGDTIGYKWENEQWVRSDGSLSGFSFSGGNAPTYRTDIATLQSEGWITEDGVLAPDHDAAHAQWGGGWRMPTVQDLNNLCYYKCDWIWTTTNGVNGYLVRGKGEYSSASIFLPCTGYGSGYSREVFSSQGYYWSSVPASSWNNAGGIVYLSNRNDIEYTSERYAGSPIRPVQDAAAEPVDPSMPLSDLYCVIDLSGGPDAESYPVSFLSGVPEGGWTAEYKTTKLVMRRIDPGTFTMGPNEYEYHRWQSQWEVGSYFRCYESDPREVTLTEPFYIGVFEVTQKQYELVTGATPSDYAGDTRSVNKVSWNDVRGNSSTYDWPSSTDVASSSFIGKIRAKTGIVTFDLPTEAKWEYACRAGTTTSFNDGHDLTDFSVDAGLNQLGHYQFTASGGLSARGASVVGSFLPNAWGLYDMHGNVCEWVLNWSSYGNPDTAVVDPVGPSSGSRRIARGGGWNTAAHNCRSGFSIEVTPSSQDYAVGFRLSLSSFASATFDENFDGGQVAVRGVFTNLTVQVSAPKDMARRGWILAGWSTSPDGECVAETELVVDGATYYAQWTEAAPAVVTFDMNYNDGGTTVTNLYVTDKVLEWAPENPERQGWVFLGWFTEATEGEKIAESDLAEDGATYYAHWSDVAFTTGGDADWYIDSSEGGAWRSGDISGSESTWLEATFSGSGSVRFEVKTSTENNWDWLCIYVDGYDNLLAQYSGDQDWTEVEFWLDDAGTHTIRFEYEKDGSVNGGSDCVWVRNFTAGAAPVAMATFADGEISTSEGDSLAVVVKGGSDDRPTSVKVYLSFLTAAATDLDLAKAAVNGVTPKGGLKFPLTLAWDTGDTEPKTISIPVKADKTVEDHETLVFQLADAVGMEIGEPSACAAVIYDANSKTLKPTVSLYKPKKGESVSTNYIYVSTNPYFEYAGFAAGTGAYPAGSKVTLTAEARPGWSFAGWRDLYSGEIVSDKVKWQVVVSQDAEYLAEFVQQPYMLGVADPADGGKIAGSGYCPAGKKVTLKATANKGFKFLGWRCGGRAETALDRGDVRAGSPLPADEDGFIATTASLVIDRTTKPAANSKTSTTISNLTESTAFYAVFEGYPRVAVTPVAFSNDCVFASVGGKVTGAGRYEVGKNVSLKATANAGFVFGGWYKTGNGEKGTGNSDKDGLISQQASFSFKMGDEDVDIFARFVTAAEDKGSIEFSLDGEDAAAAEGGAVAMSNRSGYCGVDVSWPLAATALSQTTIKVSGLPSGVKFTAKDVVDSKTKKVVVPANTIYGAPTAASKSDKDGNLTPSKVKVTVTTAGKSSQNFEFDWTVQPLPQWVVGTFDGTVSAYDGMPPDALVSALTVGSNGKISGKFVGSQTYTLSAPSFTYAEEDGSFFYATVVATSGRLAITNEIAFSAEPLTAPDGSAAVRGVATGWTSTGFDIDAWQNLWKAEPWKSAMAARAKDVPTYNQNVDGGTVSLKFAASGAVTAKGEFVVGFDEKKNKDIVYAATCSSVLIPEGDRVYIVFAPNGAKGFKGWSGVIRFGAAME